MEFLAATPSAVTMSISITILINLTGKFFEKNYPSSKTISITTDLKKILKTQLIHKN